MRSSLRKARGSRHVQRNATLLKHGVTPKLHIGQSALHFQNASGITALAADSLTPTSSRCVNVSSASPDGSCGTSTVKFWWNPSCGGPLAWGSHEPLKSTSPTPPGLLGLMLGHELPGQVVIPRIIATWSMLVSASYGSMLSTVEDMVEWGDTTRDILAAGRRLQSRNQM